MTDFERDTWMVPYESKLYWHSWGDEFVVYDGGSGDTHLLDAVGANALQSLEREPATLSELTEKMAASWDLEVQGELSDYLARLLSNLHKLGLVNPVEP